MPFEGGKRFGCPYVCCSAILRSLVLAGELLAHWLQVKQNAGLSNRSQNARNALEYAGNKRQPVCTCR